MTIDDELTAFTEAIAANSSSTPPLRRGLALDDARLADVPPAVAGIWRWRDGQEHGGEFIPRARFLPLDEALRRGAAMLGSRRAVPEHPDQRPGASWLAFVSDGTVAHVVEHGPDVPTRALVFDPSGFVDDHPIVPVSELVRLWRRTIERDAWRYGERGWEVERSRYPDGPARQLLLV